ncbi:hypothetical protein niasHT_038508 [Heterodera trifolii]|uniref:FHA domain-containing protein n=1 Tax=Heterodera trifolii TaxID=157864 RepID=A0ABD2IW98_9BILA
MNTTMSIDGKVDGEEEEERGSHRRAAGTSRNGRTTRSKRRRAGEKKRRSSNSTGEEEKEKPSFVPSGKLAKDTNTTRPYINDLGSGNGTFLNGDRIEAQRYYELREKDVLRFGFSSREYVLLHEHSAAVGADDEAEGDTSADEAEGDEVMDGLVDRTGGEERIAAAEEDDLF